MPPSIKILSVIEATTMNAVAKGTLEFYRTARELTDAGEVSIEGRVITFDRSDQNEPNEFVRTFRAAGIEVDQIPERRRFDLGVIPALRKVVEVHQPDIVVTQSVKSHFLMWRSRLWRAVPWVAFHHGYTATDRKMQLYNRLDRWSLRKADRVLTVCHAFARELANTTGVPIEKISVHHNAIGPFRGANAADLESLKQRYQLAETDRIILSIGRLSKEKAHIDLVRAFVELCERSPEINARLIIVGDGSERDRLKLAAQNTTFGDRIVFAGQIINVQPFYSIADVFVLPSHSEGSPHALLEAMAANVPVVATAVGGVPEIVENEESALLVSANDPTAMAEAIARVLADDEFARRLTKNAADLITEKHSPEQYARSLLHCYTTTIAARKSENDG
jgi:glycosyltransferase involved in cell wall biosynthesis